MSEYDNKSSVFKFNVFVVEMNRLFVPGKHK